MGSTRKPKKSREEKRRSARKGALLYVLVTAGLLALTIGTGSCAKERYERTSLTSLLTGSPRYGRLRLTTCGFVRGVLPGPIDAIPCQVWNLMPLTAIGMFALGWLVLDLAGLNRRRVD